MDKINKYENEIIEKIEALREDIDAIQQPRSDFALKHFVVGMHDTPGRQRMQAVLELQIKMFNIRRVQLEEKKLHIERRRQQGIVKGWNTFKRSLAEIEIERIDIDLADMNLARLGAIREAKCLLAILDNLPKYTYEQLQEEEVLYWQARLSRQALTDLKSMGTIGVGNAEAIMQMFRELGSREVQFLPMESLKAIGKLEDVS